MNLLTNIIFTTCFLPIYLFLRRQFFNLPLHQDTGFYVSNHTIISRKFSYRKGWNSEFAFCSKVLPEYFYSVIYLKHGGESYPFYSRFYYSIYNYLTSIFLGTISFFLSDGHPAAYCSGLVCYAFFSSQPFFGIYFESAEQFEPLFQVISFFLLTFGFKYHQNFSIFLGLSVLIFESLFIKTSSLIAAFLIIVFFIISQSGFWLAVAGAIILIGALYVYWLFYNQKKTSFLFSSTIKHEIYWQGKPTFLKLFKQLIRKTVFLGYCLLMDFPVLLILSILGGISMDFGTSCLVIYLLLGCVVYYVQAAKIWYFLIPLLPPLALLGSAGIVKLINVYGTAGFIFAVLLLLAWFVYYCVRYRDAEEALNLKVWKPYGSSMAMRNFLLTKYLLKIKSVVNWQSLFVYGVCNQAYVLLDTAYSTNIISAAPWLDCMKRDWQESLNRQLVAEPPSFIFSVDECFTIDTIRNELGLNYKQVGIAETNFHLYQYFGSVEHVQPNFLSKPYQSEMLLKNRE